MLETQWAFESGPITQSAWAGHHQPIQRKQCLFYRTNKHSPTLYWRYTHKNHIQAPKYNHREICSHYFQQYSSTWIYLKTALKQLFQFYSHVILHALMHSATNKSSSHVWTECKPSSCSDLASIKRKQIIFSYSPKKCVISLIIVWGQIACNVK